MSSVQQVIARYCAKHPSRLNAAGGVCAKLVMSPVVLLCLQALEQLIARYCDTHPSQLDAAVEKELTRQRDVVEIKNTLLKHRVREASKATKQVSVGGACGTWDMSLIHSCGLPWSWVAVWGALCRGDGVQPGYCTGAVLV